MGQLERYGLYVLCLVIFLILGVAIWGGDPPPPAGIENLAADLERPSAPIQEGLAPRPVAADPVTLSQLLDASRSVSMGVQTPPPARPETRLREASAPAEERPEAPVATQARYYVIQKNDTLSEISLRELGTSLRWPEIEALNPGVDPDKLIPEEKLLMPSRSSDGPSVSGRQFFLYTVKENDNPSSISKYLYGTEAWAKKILDLNPGMDPLKMKVGSEIKVPLRK